MIQEHIFKTWIMLKRVSSLENDMLEPYHNGNSSNDKNSSNNELDNYFRMKFLQTASTSSQIEKNDEDMQQKIINISSQVKLTFFENVLDNWEMRRFDDPTLFELSQVILAVPPTQVSVERAFSALGLVLSARRNRLSDNAINDLLICKLNSDIFDQI
jgi:hAT family C-terminal dimerisation region